MFRSRFVVTIAASCMLSACATIVSGPMQSVKIDSNPQGARVFTAVTRMVNRNREHTKRKEVGVTPTTVSITRKDGAVLLEKEGYHPAEVMLKRDMNPWFLGNFLMTSLVSTSIDTSTGAANEYDPDEYMVQLYPLTPAAEPAPEAPEAEPAPEVEAPPEAPEPAAEGAPASK